MTSSDGDFLRGGSRLRVVGHVNFVVVLFYVIQPELISMAR
jgi:hypothetical protein